MFFPMTTLLQVPYTEKVYFSLHGKNISLLFTWLISQSTLEGRFLESVKENLNASFTGHFS